MTCATCGGEEVISFPTCFGGEDHAGHNCFGTICGEKESPCPECVGEEFDEPLDAFDEAYERACARGWRD